MARNPSRTPGTSGRDNDGWSRALLLLAGAALAVRLVYVFELSHRSPFWGHPYLDASYYLAWAREILAGDIFGHEVFIRAPLYPYFLALLGKVFGIGPAVVAIAQALLGTATCVLTAVVGRFAFDRRTGILAGWVAAFHGALVYWGGETLIETLLLPLVLLSLWLAMRALASGALRDWILSGLFAGLAGLARPTAMVLVPVVALAAIVGHRAAVATDTPSGEGRGEQDRRSRPSATRWSGSGWKRAVIAGWKQAGAAALAGGLILGLASLRNAVVGGDFVPVASHGGINFWTGNNARSDGKIVVVPEGIEITPEWKGKDNLIAMSVIGAERAAGRALKPSEVSSYWVRLTLDWMRSHPLAVITLYLRKVYFFWAGCEYTNNEDVYSFRRFSTALSVLLLPLGPVYLPGAILMPLALLGLILAAREWRRRFPLYGFIGGTFLVVILFFVSSRHRLPVVPPALIFASFAAVRLAAGRERTRTAIAAGVLALALGINPGARPAGTIAQFGQFEYSAHVRRAQEEREAGNLARAEVEFRRALAIRPEDAESHSDLGLLFVRQGRMGEARSEFESAVRLEPENSRFLRALGVWFLQSGDRESARRHLEEARRRGARLEPALLEAAGIGLETGTPGGGEKE